MVETVTVTPPVCSYGQIGTGIGIVDPATGAPLDPRNANNLYWYWDGSQWQPTLLAKIEHKLCLAEHWVATKMQSVDQVIFDTLDSMWAELKGIWNGIMGSGARAWSDVTSTLKSAAKTLHDDLNTFLQWLQQQIEKTAQGLGIGLAVVAAVIIAFWFGPELIGAYAVTHRSDSARRSKEYA